MSPGGRRLAFAVFFPVFAGAVLALVTAVGGAGAASAAPACYPESGAAHAMTSLRAVMARGRFVAYQPTTLQIVNGRSTQADPASIRGDLEVLRDRFDGLVTYGSINGAEQIPAIAAAAGFRAVVIGVWDPFDPVQLSAALAAVRAHPDIVVGLSLGNEMVFEKRRSFGELAALIDGVRQQAPGVGITTTEPFHMYYQPAAAPLLGRMDFMLVNIHPIFQPWFREAPDANAAQFVVNVVTTLQDSYCGPIVVKEVGVPTAPATSGFTPERQASFFTELRTRFPSSDRRAFAYFAAFDAPWRSEQASSPAEGHWGLYDEHRMPKLAVRQIPPLRGASGAAGAN